MYHLEIEEAARKALKRVPGNIRQRVAHAIDGLRLNPRPSGAKALRNHLEGYWRIRIDDYRVIYLIDDEVVIVTVVRIAQRDNDTYEDLI